MAVELKFERNDPSIPWGFRLTGGSDLNLPLTVIKVNEQSIAENIGMKVGDLLVKVGNTATAGLTHLQAHDLLKEAGNIFIAAIIRGEMPEHYTETEETFDSETTSDGLIQSLQINVKTNVVDKTEIIVETGEIVEQNIKINGEVSTDEIAMKVDSKARTKSKSSERYILEEEIIEDEITEAVLKPEKMEETSGAMFDFKEKLDFIHDSEVLKVIKEETNETQAEENVKKEEKRWTTFLQKPNHPKPMRKQMEQPELPKEPPYKVVIQRVKKQLDSRSESGSQGSTPVPEELLAATPDHILEKERKETDDEVEYKAQENDETEIDNEIQDSENVESDQQPVISEVEMSLEDQLTTIQKQLMALSQLPATIQLTLDAVTQQLTKIVGPVLDPNKEEIEIDAQETQEEVDYETEDKTNELLETLEEVSEVDLDREYQEGVREHSEGEVTENDRIESGVHETVDESEMLQATPEPDPYAGLTPEERLKMDKQQKENPILHELRQRRQITERSSAPLAPLQRPICLPGGRKWYVPDDAHPSPQQRHPDMSDDLIAETLSGQAEILTGTTLGLTIGTIFGHGVTIWAGKSIACHHCKSKIFRDSNTHLVPSHVSETKKINFLKYQPPVKTLDHLQHSEVFRLVHDMEPPARGIASRQGKAMAEEDYYNKVRSSSNQEGQIKG